MSSNPKNVLFYCNKLLYYKVRLEALEKRPLFYICLKNWTKFKSFIFCGSTNCSSTREFVRQTDKLDVQLVYYPAGSNGSAAGS